MRLLVSFTHLCGLVLFSILYIAIPLFEIGYCIAANLEVKEILTRPFVAVVRDIRDYVHSTFLLVSYLESRRERLFWIECISFQIYNTLYTQQACSIPRETANLSIIRMQFIGLIIYTQIKQPTHFFILLQIRWYNDLCPNSLFLHFNK